MALRKLAGPFNIVDENGNPPTSMGGNVAWVPYMGLAIRARASDWGDSTSIGILSLDGVLNELAHAYYSAVWGWDAANHVIIVRGYPDPDYVLDGRSFVGYLVAGAPGSMATFIKLPDRRLKVDVYTVIAIAADGTESTEFTDTGLRNSPSISAGRLDDEFFITENRPSGGYLRCRFYNSSQRSVSPMMYVPALSDGSAWAVRYAPELQVIVAVDCDNYAVSVWSLESLPDHVTAPALLSGSVAKGNIAQYRCQVPGDQGEPCASELVDWSITGDGELLDLQSATDVDGYALARVLYHLGDGGDSTVTASVRC